MSERITVKRAKELCREKIGRLPRIGCEVEVEKGEEEMTIRDLKDRPVGGKFEFVSYLSNEGGNYRVWTWYAPFPSYR